MAPARPDAGRSPGRGPVETARDGAAAAREAGSDLLSSLKPKLRGWIHAGMAPLALTFAIVMIVLAPAGAARISVAVFGVATVLLFGTSAVYHRGTWSPPVLAVLRRLDHANIFLVIAGTYTPLSVLLLPQRLAVTLLLIVWIGAAAGIAMRVFWLQAPRWLYVPIYLALGWVAIGFIPAFWSSGGAAVAWLIMAGGLGYTLGAVVYGLKRPNPSPRWFGFHEIFHSGTVIGYVCHAVAIALVALR